jgi:glycosyltransferase involved in cell wall biosynthesis
MTKPKIQTVSLVIPVFNEQDSIKIFLDRINQTFKKNFFLRLELLFVNDGSSDNTLESLRKAQKSDNRITIIDLSRNFGKEAALSAGLEIATGDCIVPIDVDLQDPPELIPEMIKKWKEGYEVVLARRNDRSSDSLVKRVSSSLFYKAYNKIAKTKLPENVGDFRLMDRAVVNAINKLSESQRFMKGLFAWIGFKTSYVDYTRPIRKVGKSKFSGWKLWNLAIEGITSFSIEPLRIWTYFGFFISLISILFAIFIVIKTTVYGIETPGYASLAVLIIFLGGIQLIGVGIIGEYLGRTYIESKNRPIYIVRSIYSNSSSRKK